MALFLLVASGSVLVTGGSAQAFLPLDARQAPPDFGRLDRARVPDPARQAALTHGKEWARFVAVHPGAWRVTWDDRAGTPRSIYGARIPLGLAPSADAKSVEAASRALLAQLGPLVGVVDAQLATKTVEKVHDTWFVQLDRVTSNGTPVLGAFAALQIENGDVVALRIETHPTAETNLPAAKITATGAEAIVAQSLTPWGITNEKSTSRAVVAHVPYAGAWRYVPAFEVDTVAGPGNHWVSVVDATDGVVLSRESKILYATSGTITGLVEPRTPVDTKVVLPYAFIDVTGTSAAVADSAGNYTAASAGASSMVLNGSLVTLQNQGGANAQLAFDSSSTASPEWSVGGTGVTNADQPQLDAYHSANVVRIWASHAFLNPQDEPSGYSSWLASPMPYNINLNQNCNSFWNNGDDSVNLFVAGGGCNNTAQLADVVYHETGHGLHNATIVTGTFDGALSEGTADFTSAQITADSKIGPYFFTDGTPVRDLTQLVVYPQDLTGEVHNDGLTWGGSWWDLRTALLTKYGAAGPAKVADLFVKSLEVGPDLSGAFDAVIQADGSGTPDECEIVSAFARHGLTAGSNLAQLTHTEVASPAPAGQAISITATTPSSSCAALTATGAKVFYTVDGAGQQSVDMTLAGSTLTAQIPAQKAGHVVRYWFVETMQDGSTVTTPANAPNDEGYGFYVGTLHTIWKDDFETDKGWTHSASAGTDDWQRGAPTGSTNDPADAYSGANVFGNNLGGDYQSMTTEDATSPSIDCRGVKGARLEFRRWLSVEESSYDHATVEVSNNGGSTWTQLYLNPSNNGASGSFPKDNMWTFEDYDISQIADGHKIQIRFHLDSDQAAEYGGWTLDDVAIVSPNAAGSVGGGHGGCGCDLSRGEAQGLGSSLLLGGLALGSLVLRKARSRRDA